MCVKLSLKDVHDGGVYSSKKTKKREKAKEKKGGKKDLSKCPILDNWLVLMTCHSKKNNVMES